MKGGFCAIILFISFIFLVQNSLVYGKENVKIFNQEERKAAIVACANNHLHSCELLLKQDIPSVRKCNVRTECEFSGWLYMQVKDYVQALPYLQKACDNKHYEGCNKLGESYQVLKDYKKAKKSYKIACDNNNINGCYYLALLYYEGLGVRHSYENANALYKKACDNRLGIGCLKLAMSYAQGYGVFQNLVATQQFLQKGCELGNNESCDLYDIYKDNEEENESDI